MSKETTKTLLPKLRFPEFRDEREWDIKLLGGISEIVRGGSPRPIEDFLTTDVEGLNWLKIGDVAADSKYISQTQERVIKEALTKTREVNPGDLILSNSMSFGRPYILKIKSCIHDGWIAIRNISKGIHKDYLYYYISSDHCQTYFLINAAGAAVKNLNAEIIKLLPVFFPLICEQQQIADCLSSIDNLITAQNQKHDTLKVHKKGLMQQLFPSINE
jgi:type I restriction enzyme S subunit